MGSTGQVYSNIAEFQLSKTATGGQADTRLDIRLNNNTDASFTTPLSLAGVGRVGVASTTPWRTLSVTGTVGFDGLTGATGAGSLCLDSNKQVVYNSASDACLSSTRATKHEISPLVLGRARASPRAPTRLIHL